MTDSGLKAGQSSRLLKALQGNFGHLVFIIFLRVDAEQHFDTGDHA